MNVEEAWARIRMTRATPPAAATFDDDRLDTYVTALEQAQQMFAAAIASGVAVRPLLIFYGLSQAGRAVAAASPRLHGAEYRLEGDGIKATKLNGDIAAIAVYRPRGSQEGSFVRLSQVLDSPAWNGAHPVELGELWRSLPEGNEWPLDQTFRLPPLPVRTDHPAMSDGLFHGNTIYLDRVPGRFLPLAPMTTAPDLPAFLACYPALQGYTEAYPTQIQVPDFSSIVWLDYPSASHDLGTLTAEANARSVPYPDGQRYAFPAVGSNDKALHPLMAWWAVLYTLSMLARYQPQAWARYIALRNTTAVPIEQLLGAALKVVPALLLQTIQDVAAPP
jgi:hypothetical protein